MVDPDLFNFINLLTPTTKKGIYLYGFYFGSILIFSGIAAIGKYNQYLLDKKEREEYITLDKLDLIDKNGERIRKDEE